MPNIFSSAVYGGNLDPSGYAGDDSGGYSSIFGGIPAPISLPNPFGDLSATGINLRQLNPAASADLSAQFGGSVSPGTQTLLQNLDAAQGVRAGMPGSQLFRNKTLRDLGLTSEQEVNNAFRNYSSLIPAVSGTQTVNPALQTSVASRNATMAAAPNPSNAASYAQQIFDKYLQALRGPAGGTATGTSPAGSVGFGLAPQDTTTATPTTAPDQSQQIQDALNPDTNLMDLQSLDPFSDLA